MPRTLAAVAVLTAAVLPLPQVSRADAVPAGWVEYAAVYPGGLIYSAKLDSGARHSSVHARIVRIWKQDGADWVRFRLKADDGTQRTYELPVVRLSRTRDMTGPTIVRPVVRLRICVGNRFGEVEVNLSDRKGFNHGLLIGRSFLKNRFLVNSGDRLLHKLGCAEAAEN